MRKVFFLVCLLISVLLLLDEDLCAQEVPEMYVVGNAELREDELVGQNKRDENGEHCAIIKIVSNLDELQFTSYNGVVEIDNSKPGLYLVYVSPGERVVEVYRTGFKPLKIILNEVGISRVESGHVWQLEITGDLSVLLDTGTGDLVLETQPPGAEILIEAFPNFKAFTPYEFIDYPALPYRVFLRKFRYEPVDTLITIVKDTQNKISIELMPSSEIPSSLGSISIISNPDSAEIFLDDEYVGLTPLSDYLSSLGDHVVQLKLKGYKDINQNITVPYEERVEVSYTLVKTLPWYRQKKYQFLIAGSATAVIGIIYSDYSKNPDKDTSTLIIDIPVP